MGNGLVSLVRGILSGKGWGNDAWPVVGVVGGGFLADECGLSSALVLSLCLSYLSNQLPPILPVPLRVPYIPQ